MNRFTLILLTVLATACGSAPKNIEGKILPTKLYTQSYLSSDTGFAVNSHLIVGSNDAILVDAQFTKTEAKKVVEMIQNTEKNLTTVFITHGHPDHYFGLDVILAAYPKAKVLTTPGVLADIQATSQAKLTYWTTQYKDEMPAKIVIPSSSNSKELTLDGQKILIHEVGRGESDHAVVLYIPSTKVLISGDLMSNSVHLWLAENHPTEWLKNLDTVKTWATNQGGIERVLPGHGENGSIELFSDNRDYILAYVKTTTKSATKQQAMEALTKKYSEYRLPIMADLSVGARLKK